MNAFACLRREPDLDDVMKEPIVRLLMRQDRVTELEIRDLGHAIRRRQGEASQDCGCQP